jgi:hypothetical protein
VILCRAGADSCWPNDPLPLRGFNPTTRDIDVEYDAPGAYDQLSRDNRRPSASLLASVNLGIGGIPAR